MKFLNLQQFLIEIPQGIDIRQLIDIEPIKQFLVPVLQILGGIVGLYILFMIISTIFNVRRTKRVFMTFGNTEKIKNKLEKIEEKIENLEVKINKILEKD